MIVTVTELDAGGGGGAGAGASPVGMFPAKTVIERAHVSAKANAKRFILVSLI